MSKLIITESDRQDILRQHGIISEQIQGSLSAIRRGLSSAAQKAVLEIPSIARRGFKNMDEVIEALGKRGSGALTKGEKSQILNALFKNSKGKSRDQIAVIFTNSKRFKKEYLRKTEEATRTALKNSGKYADDEIEAIINAHKRNTGTSTWSNQLRNTGSYARLGDDVKKQIESIVKRDYPGQQFSRLGQGSREKVIREALLNVKKSGFTISRDALPTLKSVLRTMGLTALGVAGLTGVLSLFTSGEDGSTDGEDTQSSDDSMVLPSTTGGEKLPDNWLDGILNKEWTLMLGSHNQTGYPNIDEAIKAFQRALQIDDDGKFGPITKNAVEDFQRENDLKDDGIIGDLTLNKMIENNLIKDE